MKVIIGGTRDITEKQYLDKALAATQFPISAILSGGARGVDALARRYAWQHRIPFEEYPADWDEHGRAAGPLRNRRMAQEGDALIALWDGHSRGTRNMIEAMKALRKPVEVYLVPNCERIAV